MRKSIVKEQIMKSNHRNNQSKGTAAFLIPLFSFLICLLTTCDLLQPSNPDYYQELLDEVAYANAPYANVSIGIISGSLSAAPTEAPHQKVGYKFTVQATANAGYCTAYAELALFKTS